MANNTRTNICSSTYQGFHSSGRACIKPALAMCSKWRSLSGLIPILLAYSWISGKSYIVKIAHKFLFNPQAGKAHPCRVSWWAHAFLFVHRFRLTLGGRLVVLVEHFLADADVGHTGRECVVVSGQTQNFSSYPTMSPHHPYFVISFSSPRLRVVVCAYLDTDTVKVAAL